MHIISVWLTELMNRMISFGSEAEGAQRIHVFCLCLLENNDETADSSIIFALNINIFPLKQNIICLRTSGHISPDFTGKER